jgi:2-polyprenyl-3-methyl-5-hydroxy-6-metoxy-1,4-benzoquinol methylase
MAKTEAAGFDIKDFDARLKARNRFDGNLLHGAGKFHKETNRSGAGKPSSGFLIREHAKVVVDTGKDRYQRIEGFWEPVDKCPVCASPEREFHLTRLGLDIYKCAGCTHRYLNPRIKFDAAMNIYADDKTASDIYTQPLQIEIDEIKYQYGLDLIEQLNPPAKAKIMDLGCGAGVMLKMADRNGWERCVGVDVNERYAGIYKETKGVQFIQGRFESLDPSKLGRDYDVISMWSVLEHLYDLKSIVDTLKGMLKKNGLLFILVPNAASLATRLMREMSPTFNWKHVSHFTPKSLKHLMAAHGLECVHFETVITEIDNVKSYLSGEYPYHGHGDPEHLFDFITPEYLHKNLLGSRMIGVFRNV